MSILIAPASNFDNSAMKIGNRKANCSLQRNSSGALRLRKRDFERLPGNFKSLMSLPNPKSQGRYYLFQTVQRTLLMTCSAVVDIART